MTATISLVPVDAGHAIDISQIRYGVDEAASQAFASRRRCFRTARLYRSIREALSAKVTGALSPAAQTFALFDWAIHLRAAPGKGMKRLDKAASKTSRLLTCIAAANADPDKRPCIDPLPGDYRFRVGGAPK